MVLMRYIHLISFTRYADDIFHIMSSFHMLDNKKCRKSDKFLGKLKKKKWTLQDWLGLPFPTLSAT